MQLHDHAFGELAPALPGAESGAREKPRAALGVEARMHPGDETHRGAQLEPGRQGGDIRDETGPGHQSVALAPGVQAQHRELS